MKLKRCFLLFAALLVTLPGCDVMKEFGGAYNITQCKYSFNSISGVNLAGTNISKNFALSDAFRLTSMLTGNSSSLPLSFALNVDVMNPNNSAALLHGLEYILNIDGVQFSTGTTNQSLNIPAGGTQVLPLSIGVDLIQLMKGESKDAVVNIAKNIIGIGDKKSGITIQLKPTFMIAGKAIKSPSYIPLNFTYPL